MPSNPTPASGRTISQQLEQALAAWERFPVDDSPRPLVLVGQRVLDPLGGFPSGAAKLAYIEGAIDGPAKFPSGPGSADDYRVIGAKDAFAAFKSAAAKGPPTSTRLTVTTVRFGSGVFLTDRGPLRLPAWLFSFQSVREPAIVLTVDPTSIFTPPPVRQIDLPAFMTGAHLGSDGRTLTVEFAGAPAGTGPCTADYTLDVATSRTAVAVAVEEHAHGGNTPCLLPAVFRQVTTVLSVPLGARVVVAVSGAAVAATRSG